MYICIYVYMYICVYVYIHVLVLYVYIGKRMYVCVYLHVMCVYICIQRVYLCVYNCKAHKFENVLTYFCAKLNTLHANLCVQIILQAGFEYIHNLCTRGNS
jgi:hypothetical protein